MHADARALFARPWAIAPEHGAAFCESILAAMDARAAGGEAPAKRDDKPAATTAGVRILAMNGPMLHRPPAWLADWGIEHTDTLDLAAQVKAADADPAVSSIVIRADTPGGMVGGVPELAEAIAGASKPVRVEVDGMLASAGVWAASGADEIVATRSSEIGSIGVYTIRVDTTERQKQAGVRVHLVSSGGVKGHGADGRVTPELLAEDARVVAQLRDDFVAAVSAGRKRDMADRATGQVWLAKDARKIGLIDSIMGEKPEDSVMDYKQFAALAAAHPKIPVDELAALCDGKTDAEITAALADRAKAAELAEAKAALAAEQAKSEKLAADLKLAQDEIAKHKADAEKAAAAAAKIAGLASGAAADPGPDGDKAGAMTRAKFAALPPLEAARFIREHGASAILP